MSDIKSRLDALLKNRNLMTGTQLSAHQEVEQQKRDAGEYEIDKVVSGEEWAGIHDVSFFLVRKEYPLDYMHGSVPLGAALDAQAQHVAFSACDDELKEFNPATACFVDTETIGLSGGTGTIAFLTGVGYFEEDKFVLEQCFLRDYDEEDPMLRFLAQRFEATDAVVGYNSKSFDLPLLRTRFIQNRIPFHGEACAHYDLVHAVRRFYKRRLADCSLGNIEREVLGVHRVGDVPSYLIGHYWFDYLRTRDARPLKGVFYHHEMDILSLVTLTAWLSNCLAAEQGGGFDHIEDKLSLVRLHYRMKKYEEVEVLARVCLETDALNRSSEDAEQLRRECLDMLAIAYKKLQRFSEMQETLELLVTDFPSNATARLELVKHLEHRAKDLTRARALCLEAINAPSRHGAHTLLTEFEQRITRLEKKLSRTNLLEEL